MSVSVALYRLRNFDALIFILLFNSKIYNLVFVGECQSVIYEQKKFSFTRASGFKMLLFSY